MPVTAAEPPAPVPVPDSNTDVTIGPLDCGDLREVGSGAVLTISTAKSGNGVEQLRDGNLETFWQSDGAAPHTINIQFSRKMSVSKVCLYMDYTIDESYTSKKISIRSGTTQHDLVDISAIELHEPVGWCQINLSSENSNASASGESAVTDREPLRTHLLQVRILSMHQNGKDAHIRQLCVYGPRLETYLVFKTVDMTQYMTVR
jgi:anaphase-promoting complex subunit 10